ncbi:MAG TPA: site-2 protease family protein [Pyrinomonadaceae bacterium]|nr:site-2 protease family protein [Pyrinomonadaceae bacterium]
MSESVRDIPAFASGAAAAARGAARPGAREWARHASLFALTALTVAWAGMSLAIPADAVEPSLASPASPLEYLLFVPKYYALMLAGVASYAAAHPHYAAEGLKFAAALLSILLAHESGHYVACRLYGVDATLPCFIPVPPPFIAGTLGAFIKIKSPIPSRRALFDIGVAGPLAGFAVILPVAVLGLLTAVPDTAAHAAGGGVIVFNDPALLRMLAAPLGVRDLGAVAPNPFYFAAWFGLLVTSLNLMPVGQLDGGHAVYALLGRRAHKHAGRVAFFAMLVLAPLGWLWHGAPTGVVYVALLFVMLRLPHPAPLDDQDPLGRARTLIGILTLLVFALSFLPFPLTVT